MTLKRRAEISADISDLLLRYFGWSRLNLIIIEVILEMKLPFKWKAFFQGSLS